MINPNFVSYFIHIFLKKCNHSYLQNIVFKNNLLSTNKRVQKITLKEIPAAMIMLVSVTIGIRFVIIIFAVITGLSVSGFDLNALNLCYNKRDN